MLSNPQAHVACMPCNTLLGQVAGKLGRPEGIQGSQGMTARACESSRLWADVTILESLSQHLLVGAAYSHTAAGRPPDLQCNATLWGFIDAWRSPLRNAVCLAADTCGSSDTCHLNLAVQVGLSCSCTRRCGSLEGCHDGLLGQAMVSSTTFVVLLGLGNA